MVNLCSPCFWCGGLSGRFAYREDRGCSKYGKRRCHEDAADAQDPSERAADAVGNDSEPGGAKVDFEQLKAQNPDIYAWISVPGTGIDYPVLQKSDAKDPYDNYYLNHQVDLSEGFPGVIYSQPVNRRDFMDAVTVLYGHNLKMEECSAISMILRTKIF